jgi:hypothetical protein
MVKFPRRKRASDLDRGRFWQLKIEIRAAQEALDARSGTPHALEQTARKAASQAFVGAGLFNRSSSRRTTMLLRVTRF